MFQFELRNRKSLKNAEIKKWNEYGLTRRKAKGVQ